MQNRLLLAAQKLSNLFVPIAALAILAGFLYIAPPGILGKADALGYAVCHRIEERSFHVDGQQLPLCARCSGMYTGAVLTLAFLSFTYRSNTGAPPKWVIAILVLFGMAFAIDGGNSYLYLMKTVYGGKLSFIPTLYTPNNTLRLFTGSGAGMAMAVAVFISMNQTFWQNWNNERVLSRPRDFGILVALTLLADFLILPEWPVVMYPAAVISAGGVLLLLTLVYGMLWTIFMRQENTYQALRHAWLPILAGMTIALLQITLTDVFRLWLTHTWGGFPLG
jgi:uncharacterized membrane protein